MKRITVLLAVALLGACDLSNPIANPGFDEWCGDVPCGWEKEGEIARVSTWHSHDYAVSFESDGARLHQLGGEEFYGYPCIEFSMLAKVGAPKLAYAELDFMADGVSDWTKEIPPSDFEPLTFYVRPPDWYSGVRFIVRKEGTGVMVLAQLGARYVDETRCAGAALVTLKNLQGGTQCDDDDDQCASGECRAGYCTGCANDVDCEDGLVCGYRNVTTRAGTVANVVPVCIQPATRATGTICLGDAECESGVCCEGVCSECCGSDGCGDGVACAPSVAAGAEGFALLHQCAPGQMLGEPGDVCSDDSDCASGSCGELQCTGLCSFIGEVYGGESCALLECAPSSSCQLSCAVETVDVGRCD